MAIFTTALVPVMLTWGVDWLRGRGELVRTTEERHGNVIVGAGPLGRHLAGVLSKSRSVWLLDSNPQRCALAAADGLPARCGNALQEQALSEAGAAQADSLGTYREEEVNVDESTSGEDFARELRQEGAFLALAVRRNDEARPFHAGSRLQASGRMLLIARCRQGITFPEEPEPVYAAFVVVRGSAGRSFHLQALAAIAAGAGRPDFQERWRAADGPEELRSLLTEPAADPAHETETWT